MDIQELLKAIKVPVITWIGQSVQWKAYTATVSGSTGSAGTYAEDNVISRYYVLGKSCHVVVTKRITNKGSWSGDFRIARPIASVNSANSGLMGVVLAQGGLAQKANLVMTDEATWFYWHKNWASATLTWTDIALNDWILIRCEYEIA